jgi:GrpB-like predicted nucleotidyltransferase (UPF0157 family)
MVNPIIVVDYDPNWPELFLSFRKRIAGALGVMAAAIEHVGSTAVPGLAAKPIIDIDVLLVSEAMLPKAIERLSSLGYIYRGNLGISEREAFLPPANDPPHHLYACHTALSFEGMWRSEITFALTQRTPNSTAT